MNLALRRPDLPEPVRDELSQAYAAIRAGWDTGHDTVGQHRYALGRWNLAATQSLATGTLTRLVCTVAEETRGLTMGVTGILTIRTAGVYQLIGSAKFAANGTGLRSVRLYVRGTLLAQQTVPGDATNDSTVQVAETLPLEPGDTVELFGVQYSGGALNVAAVAGVGRQETFLRVVRWP